MLATPAKEIVSHISVTVSAFDNIYKIAPLMALKFIPPISLGLGPSPPLPIRYSGGS